jgi:hypothetical protein
MRTERNCPQSIFLYHGHAVTADGEASHADVEEDDAPDDEEEDEYEYEYDDGEIDMGGSNVDPCSYFVALEGTCSEHKNGDDDE